MHQITPLTGLKRHAHPPFSDVVCSIWQQYVVRKSNSQTSLGMCFVAKWLASLQKLGIQRAFLLLVEAICYDFLESDANPYKGKGFRMGVQQHPNERSIAIEWVINKREEIQPFPSLCSLLGE